MKIFNPIYLRALFRSSSYFAGRALRGNRLPIEQVARRTELVSKEHIFRARRPFFDNEHLNRIQPTRHFSAAEIINEHLRRDTIEFRPVRLHWVNDAWIIDGSVFISGSQRIQLTNTLAPRSLLRRLVPMPEQPMFNLEEGVLVGTCAGATWFGHWLEDEVPQHLLGSSYGTPLTAPRKPYSHESGYLTALSLRTPMEIGTGRIGSLVVIEEFAQNPHKTARFAEMRRRLAASATGSEKVFLFRGDSGTPRRMVNERELAERLSVEGFRVVEIGRASFEEIVEACRGASVVVGVEGSHLAHALFLMGDYGTLLILNPPYQVHTTVADIGVFCRLNSGMFVCQETGISGEFFADIEEVLGFLERLLRHSESEQEALRAYVDEVIAMADTKATV
jgi:hypothetical protein